MREIRIPQAKSVPKPSVSSLNGNRAAVARGPQIITGWGKSKVRLGLIGTMLRVLSGCYKNPVDWIQGLRYLMKLRRSILGSHQIQKMVRVDGLYYSDLYVPGWNDVTYERFVSTELNRFKPHGGVVNRLSQVFLSITKKCPMQCEHCSAWDTLNMKDTLGEEAFRKLIRDMNRIGFSQIYFTGGEPLVKFQLLESLISQVPKHVKSWVATSGFQLTREKAQRLKEAGLTGVFVSLDHYEEDRHNTFRNHKSAYFWALEAARNAMHSGLVVAFSLCLNDELCRPEELLKYMTFARDRGVHFVQFLEPQPVGHFKNRDVTLSKESIASAEAMYLEMNYGEKYLKYPLIHYIEYYHRRIGCFGGGRQVIYIDADGNLNACPFCQANYGSLLDGGIREKVDVMAEKGCKLFGPVSLP